MKPPILAHGSTFLRQNYLNGVNEEIQHSWTLLNNSARLTPEQSMWYKVLYNALDEYASRKGHHGRNPTDLESWIGPNNADDTGVGSFNFVCGVLGINASAARSALSKTTPEKVRSLLKDDRKYCGLSTARYVDDNHYYIRRIHHKENNGNGKIDDEGAGETKIDPVLQEEDRGPSEGD